MAETLTLERICDFVILISAFLIAITNIYKFFRKPVVWGKKRKEMADLERKERIKEVIEERMPEILEKHDKQFSEAQSKEREIAIQKAKEEAYDDMRQVLEEIKQINLKQSEQIEIIQQGTKDMLRQRIMMIYHSCKHSGRISIYDKEALDEAYKDYKKQGGNSYIDKYYKRTLNWEVFYSNDEED